MRELTFNEVGKVSGAGGHIPQLGTPNSNIPRNISGPPPEGQIPLDVQERILRGVFFNKSLDEIKEIILSNKAGFGNWPGFTILR